jgi:Alpha/beta hydrolase of unknown function (DUF900)
MTWFLDLRATAVGGIVAAEVTPCLDDNTIDIDTMTSMAAGRDILFATHGFNVDRAAGIASLGGWEAWLQLPSNTMFVGILWPGDSRWLPVIDYPVEGDEAIQSAQRLAPFLDQHFSGAGSLSFVSHSLGARLVLETIRLQQRRIRRLILMAGAIEDDCLIAEYSKAAGKVDSISVLASRSDDVLHWAYPIGNLGREIIDTLHPDWRAALGRSGPNGPVPGLHGGWQVPDTWAYGHGDYLGNNPNQEPFPLPVEVPISNATGPSPPPTLTPTWKPAWSAGLVSTRFP